MDRGSLDDSGQPPTDGPTDSSPDEEAVKMTLTGSRRAVDRMILLLHNRNIIAGSEWSRPIAIKNSIEVISVASRMIQTD